MPARSIFITGASSGIGLASALRLHDLGFRVFAGVLPGENVDMLTRRVTDRIEIVDIDITKPEMVTTAAKQISDSVGEAGLYGLFNNAGISIPGPMEFMPMEALQKQLEVNLLGHVRVTQALLPLIRQGGGGRIVNTASILGRFTAPMGGPYTISKFGMEALTQVMRQELAPHDIFVCAIEPGVIKTNIWEVNKTHGGDILAELPPEAQALYGEAFAATLEDGLQIGAVGISPEQVAEAAAHAFISGSPKTRYVVGTDANFLLALRWLLPDAVFEALFRRLQVYLASRG